MHTPDRPKNPAAVALGRLGGAATKGVPRRRSVASLRKAQAASVVARKINALAKINAVSV